MKMLPVMAFIALSASAQTAPRTVYVLPMAAGLDQYLAEALTNAHLMQIVTDPKAANLVLTDQVGAVFEQKMAELYPKDDKKSDSNLHNAFRSSRPRGTIFLVDAKSRQVLWSDYEKPPGSNSSNALIQEAERIVKKLQTSNR
jgi:hypothetical protein